MQLANPRGFMTLDRFKRSSSKKGAVLGESTLWLFENRSRLCAAMNR